MRRLLLASAVIAAIGISGFYAAARLFVAPGLLRSPVVLVVPHGRLTDVAASLAAAGVVRNAGLFQVAAAATVLEGPLHAGELTFPAHASLRTVLAILRTAHPVQHRVTFAEGLTAAQISLVLARAALLNGAIDVPPEGAVFPDTYIYQRGEAAAAILASAEADMERRLAVEWAQRAPGLVLHSPRDALILASIVEREARLPAERPMIARVFLNRLALGMRLQADPTAAYQADGGLGKSDRPLVHADLEQPGWYNTYVVPALPAGPICSPGLAAIRAVLHPAGGDALYFVADGSGGHLFTDRLSVHDANVAHLRALRP